MQPSNLPSRVLRSAGRSGGHLRDAVVHRNIHFLKKFTSFHLSLFISPLFHLITSLLYSFIFSLFILSLLLSCFFSLLVLSLLFSRSSLVFSRLSSLMSLHMSCFFSCLFSSVLSHVSSHVLLLLLSFLVSPLTCLFTCLASFLVLSSLFFSCLVSSLFLCLSVSLCFSCFSLSLSLFCLSLCLCCVVCVVSPCVCSKTPPCVRSKRLRVKIQNVPVCTGTTHVIPHAGVVPVHTGTF